MQSYRDKIAVLALDWLDATAFNYYQREKVFWKAVSDYKNALQNERDKESI